MTTYRITTTGQLPGQRYVSYVKGEIVRTTKAFVTIRTESGEIIRRSKQNVCEAVPLTREELVRPYGGRSLGYAASRPIPEPIGLKPTAPLGERVRAFRDALKRMDWHYQMSDDHRVYERGLAWEQELLAEYKALRQIAYALAVPGVSASGCCDRF